jgi:signal transduction histidine kinase
VEPNPFNLPVPVPLGTVLVGPQNWPHSDLIHSRQCVHFHEPEPALRWLLENHAKRAVESESADEFSRLVILHEGSFAGPEGGDRLIDWLEDLNTVRGPFLPILLHENIEGDQLVRFFRAGLFDALPVPVDRSAWVNMLVRAGKRFELRHQGRLLLEETGQAQVMLRDLHRQIGGQTTRNAGELLQAHETLEAANLELTEAMAELSLLYKFGRELSQAANWDGVLRDILKNLADFVKAGGAALILRSAPGGPYSPRKTWHWEETAWDKVLVNLHDQVDDAVAESIMAPGVFSVDPGQPGGQGGRGKRIIALPLEYQDIRLGYLLLLFTTPEARERVSRKYLPFLQTVQVVLSEEVAGAQMLDRIRDIGAFNSQVLETVRSAIWVVNDMGQTVFCNRSGQNMLTGKESSIGAPDEFIFQIGRGRHQNSVQHYEELPELFLDARLHLDDIQGLLLPVLMQKERSGFRGEGRITRSDGEGIPVLVQCSLMPGRVRDESWLVIVAEDLRETRKLEAERMRSEQLEGLVEMSATLAHEIRNPLMGLSAQAELLADQLPDNDPKSRYIHVITGEVERINDTITRMLNFVRPYEPIRDLINLQDICRDVLDLVSSKATDKGVHLEFAAGQGSAEPVVWDVVLDGGQIKQVLLNLLINAIDAVSTGGRVWLDLAPVQQIGIQDKLTGTRLETSGFLLEVRDDGPGIPPGDLGRIFRPFFTTKNTGTGLGLSICQKIIAAHGGEIRAARDDDHTVFRVLLPRFQSGNGTREGKQEEA